MFKVRKPVIPVIPSQLCRSMAEDASKAQRAIQELLNRLGLKEALKELRRKQQ